MSKKTSEVVIPDIQYACGCGMRGKCKQHQIKKTSPSTTLRINEWEKEFDRKFYHEQDIDGNTCEALLNNKNGKCNCQFKDIKAFISDLLAKEKMELVERIEEMEAECPMCNAKWKVGSFAYCIRELSALKSEEKEEENG